MVILHLVAAQVLPALGICQGEAKSIHLRVNEDLPKESSRSHNRRRDFTVAVWIVGRAEANTIDWGKSVDGLQMSIYHDQAEDRKSEFPKFRVELRNAGHNDLLLNLGIMSRNGGQQYPDAVSLILEDAQGKPQRLGLKKSFQPSDAGTTLFLPLPVVPPSRSRWTCTTTGAPPISNTLRFEVPNR